MTSTADDSTVPLAYYQQSADPWSKVIRVIAWFAIVLGIFGLCSTIVGVLMQTGVLSASGYTGVAQWVYLFMAFVSGTINCLNIYAGILALRWRSLARQLLLITAYVDCVIIVAGHSFQIIYALTYQVSSNYPWAYKFSWVLSTAIYSIAGLVFPSIVIVVMRQQGVKELFESLSARE